MWWLLYIFITLLVLIIVGLCVVRYYFRNQKPHSVKNLKRYIPDDFELITHQVETEDGYVLSLFNIRHKANFDKSKRPVIIQHGLAASSFTWVLGGEKLSPALTLAKLGNDVYLANSRGTVYSMFHKTHKLNSKEFWDYSFQDMRLDIVGNVQKVLKLTNHTDVNYISLSQGSVSMLAALSDCDSFISDFLNEKIFTFYCCAPVIFMKGTTMPGLKYSKYFAGWAFKVLEAFGIHGFPSRTQNIDWKAAEKSNKRVEFHKKNAWQRHEDGNLKNNTGVYGTYQRTHPMGHSVKAAQHFVQIYQTKGEDYFNKFDYGSTKLNMKKYGSPTPPKYNFGKIKTKVRIFYGDRDKYITEYSLKLLVSKISNADLKVHFMKDYGHITFVLGNEADKFYTRLLDDDHPLAEFYKNKDSNKLAKKSNG